MDIAAFVQRMRLVVGATTMTPELYWELAGAYRRLTTRQRDLAYPEEVLDHLEDGDEEGATTVFMWWAAVSSGNIGVANTQSVYIFQHEHCIRQLHIVLKDRMERS